MQIIVGAESPTLNVLDYMHPTSFGYYFLVLSKCSISGVLLSVWQEPINVLKVGTVS